MDLRDILRNGVRAMRNETLKKSHIIETAEQALKQ